MPHELLRKLEDKIDNAVEAIELLRLQVEDLEDKKAKLQEENTNLKHQYATWEKNLTSMLDKLENIEQEQKSHDTYPKVLSEKIKEDLPA